MTECCTLKANQLKLFFSKITYGKKNYHKNKTHMQYLIAKNIKTKNFLINKLTSFVCTK